MRTGKTTCIIRLSICPSVRGGGVDFSLKHQWANGRGAELSSPWRGAQGHLCHPALCCPPAKPQQGGCSEDRHLVLCLYHAGRQPCRSIIQAQHPDAMSGPMPLWGLIQWLLASVAWFSVNNSSTYWSTPYESHRLACSAAQRFTSYYKAYNHDQQTILQILMKI